MSTQNNDKFIKLENKKGVGYSLLSFFLPFLGIHRFMIGKWVSGLVLLLVCLPISITVLCITLSLGMDVWTCILAAYIVAWIISGFADMIESYEGLRADTQKYKQWKNDLQKDLDEGKITREEYDARKSAAKKQAIVGSIVAIVIIGILFVVTEFLL